MHTSNFGLFEDAFVLYSRALRLEPNSAGIHYKLGYALFGKGEYQDAIGEVRKSLAVDPSNITAHRLLASAYLANGNGQDAEKQLRNSIGQLSKSPELHSDLATCYWRPGDGPRRNRNSRPLSLCAGIRTSPFGTCQAVSPKREDGSRTGRSFDRPGSGSGELSSIP